MALEKCIKFTIEFVVINLNKLLILSKMYFKMLSVISHHSLEDLVEDLKELLNNKKK